MESTTGHEIDPAGVSHPAHYNLHPSGVECIDLIRELNFNVGSAVKYVMRRGLKEDPIKDLSKAEYYLVDHLFDGETDYGSPHRRTTKIPMGSIGNRWQWDSVIAHEPDRGARDFYLAIARFDPSAALNYVRAMIAELEG